MKPPKENQISRNENYVYENAPVYKIYDEYLKRINELLLESDEFLNREQPENNFAKPFMPDSFLEYLALDYSNCSSIVHSLVFDKLVEEYGIYSGNNCLELERLVKDEKCRYMIKKLKVEDNMIRNKKNKEYMILKKSLRLIEHILFRVKAGKLKGSIVGIGYLLRILNELEVSLLLDAQDIKIINSEFDAMKNFLHSQNTFSK